MAKVYIVTLCSDTRACSSYAVWLVNILNRASKQISLKYAHMIKRGTASRVSSHIQNCTTIPELLIAVGVARVANTLSVCITSVLGWKCAHYIVGMVTVLLTD